VATTKAAIQIIQTHPQLREKLWENAHQLYDGLRKAGYILGAEVGPVIAAMIPTKEIALSMWQGLLEQGIYVNLMIPPATPNGESLLRCSVSAAHTPKQIETIIQGFSVLHSSLEEHSESLEPQIM
jgi:8-amino-7-oxononanoate synthase